MKIKITLVVLLCFVCSAISRADVSPEKRIEIDRLLKLTGMEKLVDQMMNQMMTSFRSNMKEVPNEFWDQFAKKVHASDMIEMIVPLYDKYYSLEDLRAVNAFYSSPAGQRVLSTLPQIMKESMTIGQQWGAKIGREAVEEAKAEIEARKAKEEPNKALVPTVTSVTPAADAPVAPAAPAAHL
jgi:hypothetical protein